MLPGDWACPGCGDHQFARNTECRKCGTSNPGDGGGCGACGGGCGGGGAWAGGGKGWNSGASGGEDTMVCSAHGKKRSAGNLMDDGNGGVCCSPSSQCNVGGGAGDWSSGKGGGAAWSAGGGGCGWSAGGGGGGGGGPDMKPGDWACPGCGDHQFARNTECRKCGTGNPSGGKGGARFSPY
mmetsp:Transcript_106594/g.340063  ORF Transcript_106594/g.340063 Transcript_106594/m.340063 type:complete len:181 (-) Transcript_106594:53-595(-)